MELAKSTGLTQLEIKIKELLNAISYLLEVHIFPKEDINLNARTLLWPTEIQPIFEKNEEVLFNIKYKYGFILNHLFKNRL